MPNYKGGEKMKKSRRVAIVVMAVVLAAGFEEVRPATDHPLETCPEETRTKINAIKEEAEPLKREARKVKELAPERIRELEEQLIKFRVEVEFGLLLEVEEKKHPACKKGLRDYVEGLKFALDNLPSVFYRPAVGDDVRGTGKHHKSLPVSRQVGK